MVHLGTKYIETERLILRKFTPDDVNAVYNNWASDERVTKYLTWPRHHDITMSEAIINQWVSSYENNDFYQWALVLKGTTEPIGTISVVNVDSSSNTVEIGYCIGFKWWNKGYTSEAFKAIIPYLFNDVMVDRIESKHNTQNPRSGKVMLKCGLKFEGIQEKQMLCNQGLADVSTYGILKQDFV